MKRGRPRNDENRIDPTPSLALVDPWAKLATAVLCQAALEGLAGSPDAISWLASPDAEMYLDAAGVSLESLGAFVRSLEPGCELPSSDAHLAAARAVCHGRRGPEKITGQVS